MTRRFIAGVAVALGALMGIGPAAAQAHPLLLQSVPQAGIVAPQPPEAIRIAMSESGVARGSRIEVRDARGRPVPVSAVTTDSGGRTLSVTPRRRLGSAVYTVRWSVLGNDGHLVRGDFDFGVAGAGGAPPPGAERLGGASAGGRGGESAQAESVVTVVGRWLGVASASFLLGAFVLLARLRRREGPDGHEILERAAPLVWLLLVLAAVEGVLASATSGTGGELDLGLLTASADGRSDLARAGLVAVLSAALVAAGSRPVLRARILGLGGAVVLGTYALSGHVLSEPSFWALVDQGVHVLAAGLWLGGVLAVLLVTSRGGVPFIAAARAFAPVAGTALGIAVVTGVLAAVREVDAWYFLRWSDYGRVVLVKSVLVAGVALAGAFVWWRARSEDAPAPWPRLVRVEAVGVLVIVALAATLSGITQGRGQPLPAQRGSLFAGASYGTALLEGGGAPVTLAPARRGDNRLIVSIPPEADAPDSISARLVRSSGGGGTTRTVQLERGPSGLWSQDVALPDEGAWFAYLTVDGEASTSPVQLDVGVPRAPGSTPLDVVAVADLSGPDGDRCRSHVLGVGLALARINSEGGLDGGRKVAPRVLDSGGDPRRARALAADALGRDDALGVVGACGVGGDEAIRAARAARVPVVAGDPTVAPVPGPGVYRTAADPYAQGLAFGQVIADRVIPSATVGVTAVRTFVADDAGGRRLLAGLKAGVQGSAARIVERPAGAFARLSAQERDDLIGNARSLAIVLDAPGGGGADARALAATGRARDGLAAVPLLLSERVLSEGLVRSAGSLGRIGAIQGVSEVSPTTTDAILYRQAAPLLYRGEIASLDGLRGYVAGLALRDGVRDGVEEGAITAALRSPDVFSTALLAPWSSRQPGAGSPSLIAIQPQFLSPTLRPPSVGGTPRATAFFPDGTWQVTSGALGARPGAAPIPRL